MKMVSGINPIPTRAIELPMRKYPPIGFDNIFSSPKEKINERIPPMIIPELKKIEEIPSTPRSLSACWVQLNHGD
jgi:hypothetical protein